MFGKKERTMIFMARSTKSYEERMLQLEKKEQESLEKAKQYAAQKHLPSHTEYSKLQRKPQLRMKKPAWWPAFHASLIQTFFSHRGSPA